MKYKVRIGGEEFDYPNGGGAHYYGRIEDGGFNPSWDKKNEFNNLLKEKGVKARLRDVGPYWSINAQRSLYELRRAIEEFSKFFDCEVEIESGVVQCFRGGVCADPNLPSAYTPKLPE